MRLLTHTNIIVDDFEMAKDYPKFTFIHFLTHFHQDHWQGMTPLWNYGIIFCSEITKKFILNKFPKIENIITLELNKTYRLDCLNQKLVTDKAELVSDYTITITAFDANHIPGACMYLFNGYMGTILHTGDFRFTESMIYNNQILFPKDKVLSKYKNLWEQHQSNAKTEQDDNKIYQTFIIKNCQLLNDIAIQVDELIYDNTYCNRMFEFPVAEIVAEQMIKIISKNIGKHVYIAMGALGKEVLCQTLSRHFQSLIVVQQNKYEQLKASGCTDMSIFTTDGSKGWIEIIKRNRGQEIMQNLCTSKKSQDQICISTDFLMLEHYNPDQINFIVPYSMHSNYREMETFVRAICPSILKKLVIPFENFPEYRRKVRINPLKRFKSYLKKLEQEGESGYSYFVKNYTDFSKLSEQYLKWMHEGASQQLLSNLKIETEPSRKYRKRKINQDSNKIGPGQMLRQLEKEYVFGKINNQPKQNLEKVAQNLKATNKNQLIENFIKPKEKQKKITHDYSNESTFIDNELLQLFQEFAQKKTS